MPYPDQPNATAQATVDSELIRLARHEGGEYTITDDALDAFCSWARTVKVGDRVEAWRVRITNSVVKLALLLKLSWSDERVIDGDTMTLSTRLMSRLVGRLEEYVERHLPTDQDDARRLKVAEIIRKAGRISHQTALKTSRMKAGEFTQMMQTLAERGEVLFEEEKTPGRPATFYRWVG